MRDENPVLFCVHKHLYGSRGRQLAKSPISRGHVPAEEYLIPLGKGDIKKRGNDITVVANGLMLHRSLNVAEALDGEGVSAEVVDPRCLVPFDTELVMDSVAKTSRIVIVEEGNDRGGWGAQLAAEIACQGIGYLDAPVLRVAAPNVPIPFSPVLERAVIPDEARIRSVILEAMEQ